MRGPKIPREALRNTLRTYDELHSKLDKFLSGQIESILLIVARWGVGKTYYVKEHADRDVVYIMEGNLRPLKTYMELYEHRHKLVVLDDAETLWADKPGRILIRELTDSRFPKTISWSSTVKPLQQHQIPTRFETNSRACIICNSFRFGNTDETSAVIDRCQCYYFDPTNEEVARYVAKWFWDQDVFDFAARNLHVIDRLTARMFVKASERSRLGDPHWMNEFPVLEDIAAAVQEICLSSDFESSEERVSEFQKRTKKSRATFFRIKRDLKSRAQLVSQPPKLEFEMRGRPPNLPRGLEQIRAEVERAEREREAMFQSSGDEWEH